MLQVLPRKPKATGKKPLGAERRRGNQGCTRGEAEVPLQAPALAPGRAGPWTLGRHGSAPLLFKRQ